MAGIRQFDTGATRDSDELKNDYEGYLSPLVIEAFGDYMTEHRVQADGSLRASDNWQQGIPKAAYMKSLLRHVLTLWKLHRGYATKPELIGGKLRTATAAETCMALLFNAQGYAHELIKSQESQALAAVPTPATAAPSGDSLTTPQVATPSNPVQTTGHYGAVPYDPRTTLARSGRPSKAGAWPDTSTAGVAPSRTQGHEGAAELDEDDILF